MEIWLEGQKVKIPGLNFPSFASSIKKTARDEDVYGV